MGRKKKDNPLISALSDLGYDNIEHGDSITNVDEPDFPDVTDGNDDVDDLTNTDPVDKSTEGDKNKEDQKDPLEDTSDIPDNILNKNNPPVNDINDNNNGEGDDDDTDDTDVTDPNEATQIGAFFDAFAEANHWDVDEEEKPKTVEDLVCYIQDVVAENSKPEYADDRIAQLDQYVKNGGRFEDFYSQQSQILSYDDMDMEDETNQKAVVRDYLKMSGYDDASINSKIERYEDADLLEDEANDAVVRLKAIRQQQMEAEQEQQEQARREMEQQNKKFITDLTNSISSLSDIRGVAVPKEDRRALFDYITRTDENGMTQYQKDFNKNIVNNLIESAYFTMKGDTLLGEAKRSGQTSAASKLRTLLRHQAKNHSTYNADDKQRSVADMASKIWR